MTTGQHALGRLLTAADDAVATTGPVTTVGDLRVGVDLGTACVVVFVVDGTGLPVAGGYRFVDVVRDGVVLDAAGAARVVRDLRAETEDKIRRELTTAAVTIPPGVGPSNGRGHRYVVESAGLECTALVEEPVAANSVLGVSDGAIVDIGGGTTGIAVVRDGQVVATDDEPTGGWHLNLVIAGALRTGVEEAEQLKRDPARHAELMPLVRPVLEKIATIVARTVAGHAVTDLYLVGGTSAFTGIADVVTAVTGIRAVVPGNPLFVTPLGVAYHDRSSVPARGGWEG